MTASRAITQAERRAVQRLWKENEGWSEQCHVAALAIVREGIFPVARVARGVCKGVGGQHSWVVLGSDPYADDLNIIDPTLWSYDKSVKGVWYGSPSDGRHTPKGKGSIWSWGRPANAKGEAIDIEPEGGWSKDAADFIDLLGPLDYDGWRVLSHAPVQGWPAGEILTAIHARFPNLVPIDVLGMTTDLNPGGLYLP